MSRLMIEGIDLISNILAKNSGVKKAINPKVGTFKPITVNKSITKIDNTKIAIEI